MFFYEQHRFGLSDPYCVCTMDGGSVPYHFHRSYELILIDSGLLNVLVDGRNFTVGPGCAALIFPNQLHAYSEGVLAGHVVIFSPDLVPDFTLRHQGTLPACPVFPLPAGLNVQIQTENPYLRKALLYAICGALCDATRFVPRASTGKLALLHEMLLFVDAHYQEDCSLQRLSDDLGYDYTYLSKLFRKELGFSFTRYLNQTRVAHACVLLADTDESVTELATRCGYDTVRTFNRNFQEVVGISPTEYRRQNTTP